VQAGSDFIKRFFFTAGLSIFAAMLACESVLPFGVLLYFILFFLLCAVLSAIFLYIKQKDRFKKLFEQLLVIFIFCILGIGLWSLKYYDYSECQNKYEDKELYLSLQIVDEPKISKNGYYIYTAVPIGGIPFKYKITFVTDTYKNTEPYDNVRGTFILNKPEEDYADYNRTSDVIFNAGFINTDELEFIRINEKPFNYLFYRIKKYVGGVLDKYTGKNSGFTRSIVLGDTSGLSLSDYNSLKNSGLLHIASVSGLHISVLTGLILMLLSSMKKKRLKYFLCFLFLFVLTGVCGFSPSVLRSVFMTGVTFTGKFIRRRADSLNALGLAILLMLITSPFLIISPSLTVAAIKAFRGLRQRKAEKKVI
jgi:hypothetical protein